MTAQAPFRERLKTARRSGGLSYSALYLMRTGVDHVRDWMDRQLAVIEQRKQLVGPWTISARRFTAADNRTLWNNYSWSKKGEEWTTSPEWKDALIRGLLIPNVPEQSTVLEIGPGGGRWTEILQQRAKKLVVVDVSDRALAICRERFSSAANIEYILTDGHTLAVPDATIDVIWSFDVFVHINPMDARGYLQEFRRVLKPGGHAVIHHPGPPLADSRERPGWRSDLTDAMVSDFCREVGLRVVKQMTEFVPDPNIGDVVSIIERPA